MCVCYVFQNTPLSLTGVMMAIREKGKLLMELELKKMRRTEIVCVCVCVLGCIPKISSKIKQTALHKEWKKMGMERGF